MFDNICTLPLSADIFTQAIHPSLPLFSVGLSSGHVQAYRLPSLAAQSPAKPYSTPKNTSTESNGALPNGSALSSHAHAAQGQGRRSSGNGFDVVDTVWRTRRHKGSCRALAYSKDGHTLFSAGTDGLIKAADAQTGRVRAKVAIPTLEGDEDPEEPSVLQVLSPQALLLGTDSGSIHLYDLKVPDADAESKVSIPSAKPSNTWRPHKTDDEPGYEAITSITPLPPTAESTSGTSRTWTSTSGSTVAVTDLRKGVVRCSHDQGDLVLSACCFGQPEIARAGQKRKVNGAPGTSKDEKVFVGSATGVVTVWERNDFSDQKGRIIVQKDFGGLTDESTIDCMTTVPEELRDHVARGHMAGDPGARGGVIVVGLGNGQIKFVGRRGKGGDVLASIAHDERHADGVVTLGFDVEGRMISGGGSNVKIWLAKRKDETGVLDGELDSDEGDAEAVQMGDDSEGTSNGSGSESEEAPKKHKKKKRRKITKQGEKFGDHGVMAFAGMS